MLATEFFTQSLLNYRGGSQIFQRTSFVATADVILGNSALFEEFNYKVGEGISVSLMKLFGAACSRSECTPFDSLSGID
jgi:hypothetical protein